MNFSIIAAIGQNNELGYQGKLIWNIPSDLKLFKELTTGNTIVMGRKTFESIGRILPNRKHIVITRDSSYNISGIEVANSVLNVVGKYCNSDEEVFIIGGAEIYKQFLPYASKMYLTEIEERYDLADTYFPTFNKHRYSKEVLHDAVDNNIKYKQLKYTRK